MEPDTGDCESCPKGFAVDPDGTRIYWFSPVDNGVAMTIVSAPLDDGHNVAVYAPVSRFDQHFTSLGLDVGTRGIAVTFGNQFTGPLQPPVVVTPDSSTTLEGDVATTGPNG